MAFSHASAVWCLCVYAREYNSEATRSRKKIHYGDFAIYLGLENKHMKLHNICKSFKKRDLF